MEALMNVGWRKWDSMCAGCGVEKGDVLVVGLFWMHMWGGKECLFFKGFVYGFLKQAEV